MAAEALFKYAIALL